jgi:Flp pilus assembly protein CpaB
VAAPGISSYAQQRRRQGILALTIAVGLVGFGLYYYLSRPEPGNSRECKAGQVAMPVARVPIARGAHVAIGMLDIACRPPGEIPPDAVINPEAFQRRIALNGFAPGDYLREQDLGEAGAPGGYSGYLKAGRRAIVIPADAIDGTVGYLRRGDVVDVFSVFAAALSPSGAGARTQSFATSNAQQPGQFLPPPAAAQAARNARRGEGATARLVAEAAEVLEAPVPPRNRRDRPHLTLAVDTDAALGVEMAQSSGQTLRLVHRPFNEPPPSSPVIVRLQGDPRQVEIIKGAERSWQQARRDDDPPATIEPAVPTGTAAGPEAN